MDWVGQGTAGPETLPHGICSANTKTGEAAVMVVVVVVVVVEVAVVDDATTTATKDDGRTVVLTIINDFISWKVWVISCFKVQMLGNGIQAKAHDV